MTVSFSSLTTVNDPKQANVRFGLKEKVSQKKQEFKTAMHDKNKRYNFLGTFAGVVVLAILGVALLNNQKFFKFYETQKRTLKKYLRPEVYSIHDFPTPHGGPDVDITKGPKAIHDAWTKYINKIKANRKNNASIYTYYKEFFAQNAQRLDELQTIAKTKVLKRGAIW